MGLNKEEVAEIQRRNERDYNQLVLASVPAQRKNAANDWNEVRETSPVIAPVSLDSQLGRCQSCLVLFRSKGGTYKLCNDCYKLQG